MKALAGWRAATSLTAGLERTMAWHRQQSTIMAERRRAT
jgi:hypothetical protein